MALEDGEEHVQRVRRICNSLPATTEKLSHGEPHFFVNKRVYAALSMNHHNDGHLAVCVPAAPGVQEALIHTSASVYYRPPYVGSAGWVGIELPRIGDEELAAHLAEAWGLISAKKKAQRAR
jgi:hypothetical protein